MWFSKIALLLFFTSLYVTSNLGAPADASNSLIVTSAELTSDGKEGGSSKVHPTVPQIYQMHVQSNVSNRFAHTTVTSKVRNEADNAQEATFSVILPETAFISGFIMEVDGKNYTAYVKEKEEAKRTYDQAVASGQGAAHVAVSARDSNRFTVSVNIEPESKAAFYLSYEELLKRQEGHYELVINLHPGQPVQDLSVEVLIAESRKITKLNAPPIRSGNEIGSNINELDPRADIEIINKTSAIVRFAPNLEKQKHLAHLLGTQEENGLAGQFIVQYDVERDPSGGEVLLVDGYFVHFFAPSELEPLPKHVVFVLDTSSSMYNRKIVQLKEAMYKILEQLNDNDLFNLVEFNTNTKVWSLDNEHASVWYPQNGKRFGWNTETYSLSTLTFPSASIANADNIKKAKSTVSKFVPTDSTDIYSALQVGLRLVEVTKQNDEGNHQPLIVFLTDGDPTVRITSTDEIVNKVTENNAGLRKTPIFALSFGDGADKNFLQKLALRNSGFSKHIYEAADASLQLQDFYQQISSPLLADVTFKYERSTTSLTKTKFPIHFDGSELVVAGRYSSEELDFAVPAVDAWNGQRRLLFKPAVERSVSSIERLWAYLTVKQLLEKKETGDEDMEEIKKKALDLALKYSFVTPVSSLVVVKPNATNDVDPEIADRKEPLYPDVLYARRSGSLPRGGNVPQAPAQSIPSFAPQYPKFTNNIARPTYSMNSASDNEPQFRKFTNNFARPIYSINSASDNGALNGRSITSDIGNRYTPRGDYGLQQSYGSQNRIRAGYSRNNYEEGNSGPPRLVGMGSAVHQTDNVKIWRSQGVLPTAIPLDLFTTLPWLQSVLDENGILNLPMGTHFKLGLNTTISDHVVCSNAPISNNGQCKLLKSCPQVHSLLTSVHVWVQHFCTLNNEYAGICCPDNP